MTDQFRDTTKKVLSSAAQAVLDAAGRKTWYRNEDIAAALRAVADQLKFADDYGTRLINADDLLAIATELENHAN